MNKQMYFKITYNRLHCDDRRTAPTTRRDTTVMQEFLNEFTRLSTYCTDQIIDGQYHLKLFIINSNKPMT